MVVRIQSDVGVEQTHVIGAGVSNQSSHAASKVRLRIVPVKVRGKQPNQVVNVSLLDNGSDIQYVTASWLNSWGLQEH